MENKAIWTCKTPKIRLESWTRLAWDALYPSIKHSNDNSHQSCAIQRWSAFQAKPLLGYHCSSVWEQWLSCLRFFITRHILKLTCWWLNPKKCTFRFSHCIFRIPINKIIIVKKWNYRRNRCRWILPELDFEYCFV